MCEFEDKLEKEYQTFLENINFLRYEECFKLQNSGIKADVAYKQVGEVFDNFVKNYTLKNDR